MSQVGLSKSKYAAYCQCPKLLWLSQYRSNEAIPDPQADSRMEIGIQVGELARNYFEGTVNATEIYPDGSQNRTAMLKRTQQLIDAQTPVIAEAAFSYDGNYCAVDLLRYTPEGWIIYEVKSTTADSSEGYLSNVASRSPEPTFLRLTRHTASAIPSTSTVFSQTLTMPIRLPNFTQP